MSEHDPERLIRVFNSLFVTSKNTELVAGGKEPLYLPSSETGGYNRIEYAHGFFNSALHEVSHWCLAGAHRRTMRDYGYWYLPDGRNSQQQQEFEKVEARPQALEWMLTVACGARFHPSADNLNGEQEELVRFIRLIVEEVERFFSDGLPTDAQRFLDALHREFGTPPLEASPGREAFCVEALLL